MFGPTAEAETPYLYWVCEQLKEQAESAAGIRDKIENKGLLAFGALAAVVAFAIGFDCGSTYKAVASVAGVLALGWTGYNLVVLLRPVWVNVVEPLQYWAGDVRLRPSHARLIAIASHTRERLEERLDFNNKLRPSLLKIQWGAVAGIVAVCSAILLGGLLSGH